MKLLPGWLKPPPIHDISTDTMDPPPLTAAMQDRKPFQHPVDYPGGRVAALQKKAWPDIGPLLLPCPPEQTFQLALRQVKLRGWRILREDPAAGVIEAVAVTPLLRFRDDVVIRLRSQGGGSRLDIRSASRIGVSDLGTNARRIRSFLASLRQEL